MKNKKKAEMTSKMIVTIVLLLMGFGILLFAFSQFGEGDVDRSVCHQSVVLRGTLPDTFDLKELPALKCKTRKVCITDKVFGKGDCEEFKGQDYNTVRVSKTKQEEEINSFIAEEMKDCWNMMGEGKIQIFTRDVLTKKRCSICSRIAFDKSIKENTQKLNGLEEYFIDKEILGVESNGGNFNLNEFSTDEKAIIFIEVGKSDVIPWITGVVGSAGGCYLGAKAGALLGSFVPVGGTAVGGLVGCVGGVVLGGFGGGIGGEEIELMLSDAEFVSGQFFMDYNAKDLQGLECTSFESIS